MGLKEFFAKFKKTTTDVLDKTDIDDKLLDATKGARDKITEMTKDNTGGIFNVCLNYGGRREIVEATKKIINDGISVFDKE